jgi:anti-anti-sigma regulatory factor
MIALPGFDPPQRCDQRRCVVDCAGAQLAVDDCGPGILLRVDGEIDAANARLVGQAIGHFSRLKVPMILDVSHVEFLGVSGFRALLVVGRQRQPFCVVAGTALRRLMRIVTDTGLPVVDSIPEAVQHIEERLAGNNFHRRARQWAVNSS